MRLVAVSDRYSFQHLTISILSKLMSPPATAGAQPWSGCRHPAVEWLGACTKTAYMWPAVKINLRAFSLRSMLLRHSIRILGGGSRSRGCQPRAMGRPEEFWVTGFM